MTISDQLNLLIGLCFFILVFLLWPEKQRVRQQKAATDDRHHRSWDYEPRRFKFFRKFNHWYPDENYHEAKERQYWIRQYGITILTFLSAIAAVIIAIFAFRETHRQAEAAIEANKIGQQNLIAANRAWVGPFHTLGTEGGNLMLKFSNAGNGPALRINTDALGKQRNGTNIILIEETGKASREELENDSACMKLTVADAEPGNRFLLPHDSDMVPIGPESWIERAIQDETKTVVVLGCLTYFTMGRFAHTAYCFFYNRNVTPRGNQMYPCTYGRSAD